MPRSKARKCVAPPVPRIQSTCRTSGDRAIRGTCAQFFTRMLKTPEEQQQQHQQLSSFSDHRPRSPHSGGRAVAAAAAAACTGVLASTTTTTTTTSASSANQTAKTNDLPAFRRNAIMNYRQSIVIDQIVAMRRQEQSSSYCRQQRMRRRRTSTDNFGTLEDVKEAILVATVADSKDDKKMPLPPPLDPTCRAKITIWLYQITDFLSISRENVELAMSYLDRYLHMQSWHVDATRLPCDPCNMRSQNGEDTVPNVVEQCRTDKLQYQLCAMTCLYISIKLNETKEMPIPLLCELSHGKYSAQDVIKMEQSIVFHLRWRLSDPTVAAFCRLYIEAVSLQNLLVDTDEKEGVSSPQELVAVIQTAAEIQAQLSAGDLHLARYDKSTIAIACLRNAIGFAGGTGKELLGSRLDRIVSICMNCAGDDQSLIDKDMKDAAHRLDVLSSDSEATKMVLCDFSGNTDESISVETTDTTNSIRGCDKFDSPTANMVVSASPVCVHHDNLHF